MRVNPSRGQRHSKCVAQEQACVRGLKDLRWDGMAWDWGGIGWAGIGYLVEGGQRDTEEDRH